MTFNEHSHVMQHVKKTPSDVTLNFGNKHIIWHLFFQMLWMANLMYQQPTNLASQPTNLASQPTNLASQPTNLASQLMLYNFLLESSYLRERFFFCMIASHAILMTSTYDRHHLKPKQLEFENNLPRKQESPAIPNIHTIFERQILLNHTNSGWIQQKSWSP